MDEQNFARLKDFLNAHGYEAALICNPANITWLTGYAPPIQTGPSPFEGGPALGWLHRDEFTLILNDWESYAASALGVHVHPYSGFSLEGPLMGVQKQSQALEEVLRGYTTFKGKVAVEMDFLPAAMYEVLKASLPNATFTPIQGQIAPLRSIKTEAEIQKIRAALRFSDIAQEEIRKHIRSGVSELELWAAVKTRVEFEAGGRVPVLADLVAGARTAEVGGLPGNYIVQDGDPVMLDFVSRHEGYWGDNSAGYFAGAPHPELEKAAQVVLQALHRGREAIKPGVKAGDLDAIVRGYVLQAGYEAYPHHSGHGLGTTFHEDPRIIPEYPMVLQPNMVMVLEPGVYLPGIGGVRFEDAYLVTQDGCELLTNHLKEFWS